MAQKRSQGKCPGKNYDINARSVSYLLIQGVQSAVYFSCLNLVNF